MIWMQLNFYMDMQDLIAAQWAPPHQLWWEDISAWSRCIHPYTQTFDSSNYSHSQISPMYSGKLNRPIPSDTTAFQAIHDCHTKCLKHQEQKLGSCPRILCPTCRILCPPFGWQNMTQNALTPCLIWCHTDLWQQQILVHLLLIQKFEWEAFCKPYSKQLATSIFTGKIHWV